MLTTPRPQLLALLLTSIALLHAAPGAAEDRPTPAERAERLVYEVSWGYAKVAAMRLQVGCAEARYRPAVLVAESEGMANQLHAFHVRLDSFANPGTGRPLEGRTAIEEEGVARRFKSRFGAASSSSSSSSSSSGASGAKAAVRVEKTFRQKVTKAEYPLPVAGHDLLSWMLDLRHRPMRRGASYRYHVWDGWKLFVLESTVGPLESVGTPSGVRKAHRVELRRTVLHHGGARAFEPKDEAEELGVIWIGDDPARLPVAMDFEAPVGTARVALAGVTTRPCP